jgi:hypothetical protein
MRYVTSPKESLRPPKTSLGPSAMASLRQPPVQYRLMKTTTPCHSRLSPTAFTETAATEPQAESDDEP